jgi:uncharacterized RmlC-like cupin family protein
VGSSRDDPDEFLNRVHACKQRSSAMAQVDVVRRSDLQSGHSTEGIVRNTAFERHGITVARSRVAVGVSSAWHHHGARDLYGFMASGRLRLEYGPKGGLSVELALGDFFHIPPQLVHRDVNPSGSEEAVIVNVLVGGGLAVINVDRPGTA